MDFQLEPARVDDLDTLVPIVEAAVRESTEASGVRWDDAEVRADIREWIADGGTQVITAGEPVGVFRVLREPDLILLAEILIAPSHQRRGIGSRLIADLMDEARAAGLPLRLHVLRANSARLFYRKLGFVVTGELLSGRQLRMEWRASRTR